MSDQEFEVIASVSPRSVGPASVFDEGVAITSGNAAQYRSTESDLRDTKRALANAGFHVFDEACTDQLVQIGGSAKQFKDFFGAKITRQKAETGPGMETTFMATPEDSREALLHAPGELDALIEGVVIARPPTYFAPSAIPPISPVHASAYPFFFTPDGIGVMLRAARVHRLGVTGKEVVVAMPDTGMAPHAYYSERGYRVLTTLLGPGASEPGVDANGHGTGEGANVFACAPDARLIPVKMANDAVGAFNTAVNANPKPQVITNSWGYHMDQPGTTMPSWLKPLELAVANAVANGIVVCFSAGNGHLAFPASHPDVIAVGGVHVNLPDLSDFEASSYASSFNSTWYPGRAVPDVCGLTGNRVSHSGGGFAPSIMLPVQEGATLDTLWPPTGSTPDGWGLFSGTSAACPQVAGIVALMLERNPILSPAQVKDRLKKSARDVKKGTTATGHTATTGPDLATGAGLADAKWAYLNTMADVASTFFNAPKEQQLAMVSEGRMPTISPEFVSDLIETLRSR
jgi:subtilisin family serine protease